MILIFGDGKCRGQYSKRVNSTESEWRPDESELVDYFDQRLLFIFIFVCVKSIGREEDQKLTFEGVQKMNVLPTTTPVRSCSVVLAPLFN